MFLMKAYAITGAGNWVTINGTHVLIGGNGKIMKGPAKFIGSTIEEISNSGKLEYSDSSSNTSNGRISLTKEAESWGWTQKDIDTLNAKLSPDASLRWGDRNNGKLHIEVTNSNGKTNTVAVIHPTVGLKGQDQVSVTGHYIERDYTTMGRAVTSINKALGYKETSKSPSNGGKFASPQAQRYSDEFNKSKTVGSRVTTQSKYPSGITTTAQKRAYTRAINRGMTSSEAKKSALGGASN